MGRWWPSMMSISKTSIIYSIYWIRCTYGHPENWVETLRNFGELEGTLLFVKNEWSLSLLKLRDIKKTSVQTSVCLSIFGWGLGASHAIPFGLYLPRSCPISSFSAKRVEGSTSDKHLLYNFTSGSCKHFRFHFRYMCFGHDNQGGNPSTLRHHQRWS